MEHTKGKLEISNNGFETENIITDGRYMIACTGDSGDWHWHFNNTAESDAKEIVRRWNAFEPSGIVENVCNQLMDLYDSCSYATSPEIYGTILGLHEKLEAALAKSRES